MAAKGGRGSKRKSGPNHRPTAATRKRVEQLSAVGIPQTDISAVMGIAKTTLIKHYRDELDTAAAKANAMVGGALYNKAIGGDTASMIFWLKTRARWREQDRSEDLEEEAQPLKVSFTVSAAKEAVKVTNGET